MTALEITRDEIGSFSLEAYKARKARMGTPVTGRVVLAPVFVSAPAPVPPPAHFFDEDERKPARAKPMNARPDLARQIYRSQWPVRVGRLQSVIQAKNAMMAAERRRRRLMSQQQRRKAAAESQKKLSIDTTMFSPVGVRAGYAVKPKDVFRAMRPGLPSGLTPERVFASNRVEIAALARAIIYYFMKDGLGISYASIGRSFGKDHTTVMWGSKRARKMIADGELIDPKPYLLGLPSLSIAAE